MNSKIIEMIHTVGDSHCIYGWSGVIKHHLGPVLCYTFGKEKLARCNVLDFKLQENDSIVFCFGEIDCRCHIYKHVNEERTYESIINDIIDSYFQAIKTNIEQLKIKLKNICVYNVVPPIEKYNTVENPEYPYLGSDEERKKYVLYFNERIKKSCIENNYLFFDVYDKYCDTNGYLRKDLSDGNVHISEGYWLINFINKHSL